MKGRLRTQMSFGFALIILIVVGLISLVSTILITREFESYMEKQQAEYSDDLAAGLAMQYSEANGWNVDYIHGMGMYALNDGYIIRVYDLDGGTVWDAENHDMEFCHNIMKEIEERMQSLRNGRNGQFITKEYGLESGGEVVGTAKITYYSPYYYNENAFDFVRSMNIILWVIGVLSVAAAVCVGIIFAKKITVPVVTVTEIADEISNGNYSVRADEKTGTVELKELSVSINNMAEKIERQETLRKQLTSDVAHELRTPLANLSAQLELITEGVVEPSPERINGISEEIERLSALVGELEKLQSIENNVLEKTEIDLAEVARSTAETFGTEALKNQGYTITVEGESAILCADEGKIRQVIINLLSNAVKYSPDGGRIEVAVRDRGEEVLLSVKDNGIGISEKDKPLIFERFYRTDKSRNRKTGGVGIGLTIVSAIVKAHGGKIEVESSEGQGSTFTVTLPKT